MKKAKKCHGSCVMCYVSHVTYHMLHITCHLSTIISTYTDPHPAISISATLFDQKSPFLYVLVIDTWAIITHLNTGIRTITLKPLWSQLSENTSGIMNLLTQCFFLLSGILRFILPCKSLRQPIVQNGIQNFQISFLFLVQSYQKHIALVYFL